MGYFGKPEHQCVQANVRYGDEEEVDCCAKGALSSSDTEDVCVRGGWPQFDKFGFESQNTKYECEVKDECPLSWDRLRAEIDAGRPVAFSWHYDGGGGHMMVASGYVFQPPDGRYVVVDNPWPPGSGDSELITYERYVTGPYKHWRDYYGIQPVQPAEMEESQS